MLTNKTLFMQPTPRSEVSPVRVVLETFLSSK